jgi:hypothetical protein
MLLATRIISILEIFRKWTSVRNVEKWSRSTGWKVVEQVNMTGKTVRLRMQKYMVVEGMSVDSAPKVSGPAETWIGKESDYALNTHCYYKPTFQSKHWPVMRPRFSSKIQKEICTGNIQNLQLICRISKSNIGNHSDTVNWSQNSCIMRKC